MDIWIFNSIGCIGSLPDILRFREYMMYTNSDTQQSLSITAWIYIPKSIKMTSDNMGELVTSNQFIFLMELKNGFMFNAQIFSNKCFSRCTFLFRSSCDWDTTEINTFSNIQVWTDGKKVYENKTIGINVKDHDIVAQYNWLIRPYDKWKSDSSPSNNQYVPHKTIYEEASNPRLSVMYTKRECVIADAYNISLWQLWSFYIRNSVCTGNNERYSILVVIDVIAQLLFEYKL
eukprot:2622_1